VRASTHVERRQSWPGRNLSSFWARRAVWASRSPRNPEGAEESSRRSNLDALKVKLDDEDRSAIAALPKDQRYPPFAPDWTA
jgi:hypothetical protein